MKNLVRVQKLKWLGTGVATFLLGSFLLSQAASRVPSTITPNADQIKVEKTIQAILDSDPKKDKGKSGKINHQTFTVSEKELNAYLDYRIKTEPQKTIKSMVVTLDDSNSLSIKTLVDFSQVKVPADSAAALLVRFFNGDQYIKVNGTLTATRGKGEFQLSRAELGGTPLPPVLVNRLLKMFGEKQTPPFDPTKPFELPHGVQEIEIHKGYVKIKT